jgi:hypothetical protein
MRVKITIIRNAGARRFQRYFAHAAIAGRVRIPRYFARAAIAGRAGFLEFEIVFFAAPEPLFEPLRFALNFVDFLVEQLFVAAGHEPVVVFV